MNKYIYSIDGTNDSNYYGSYDLAVKALGDSFAPAVGDSNFANGGDENSSPRFESFPNPLLAPSVAYIRRHNLVVE